MFRVFVLALNLALIHAKSPPKEGHSLLVVSFDGISPEVAETLPKLVALKPNAAVPKYVQSVFPTKTFSTHFSIATGELPSVHGVYGNTQFDTDGNKIFNHPKQYRYVEDILPIWSQNEKEHDGRNSGTMMWPGAQFQYGGNVKSKDKEFKNYSDDGNDENDEEDATKNDDDNYENGTRQDYYVPYQPKNMKWEDRVDEMFQWITNSDKRANLVMGYFEDFGSIDTKQKDTKKEEHQTKVNNIIGYIMGKVEKMNLKDNLDLIFMSDHGTSASEGKDILVIDEILTTKIEKKDIISAGPLVYIRPGEAKYDDVLDQLKADSKKHGQYKVYTRNELEWNLKELNVLEKVITVIANPPWTFYTRQQLDVIKKNKNLNQNQISQDLNGYDNKESSMNGFFYGIGPSFKDNVKVDGHFRIDEVYPLIKHIIGLPLEEVKPVQKNVDLDEVAKKLLEESTFEKKP